MCNLLLLLVALASLSGYAPKIRPVRDSGAVEFLMLREGICRTGWVSRRGSEFVVRNITTIPCPVTELATYK